VNVRKKGVEMGDDLLDHEEALRRIDAHLGECVFFGIIVRRVPGMDYDSEIVMVSGELNSDLPVQPPRVGSDVGDYNVGSGMSGWGFRLPPMPGRILERESGLNFEVSEHLVIRVAWRPASEKPPVGPEGVVFPANDAAPGGPADVQRDHELVLEDTTPRKYWAEVIEERRQEGHKVEWQGTGLTGKHAEEAAMAVFEERCGYRPRMYFSAAYDNDPKRMRIKARPAYGQHPAGSQ
jgi:hypothetical protein